MKDIDRIIQAIDQYLIINRLQEGDAPNIAKELDRQGILRNYTNGKPLRDLLRSGAIPHAYQVGHTWHIPISPVTSQAPKKMPIAIPTQENSNSTCKTCLPPIVFEDSEILILGTMPGEESLKSGHYYDNPSNKFWAILAVIFNDKKLPQTYEEKLSLLAENHLALWDSFKSCQRDGSSDASIRESEPNDINAFLMQHSTIKKVIFNGQEAAKAIKLSIDSAIAPSTSKRNPLQFSEKVEAWRNSL